MPFGMLFCIGGRSNLLPPCRKLFKTVGFESEGVGGKNCVYVRSLARQQVNKSTT